MSDSKLEVARNLVEILEELGRSITTNHAKTSLSTNPLGRLFA
jgi:hypothetical protein